MADFLQALEEVKPAFGAVLDSLESYRLHGKGACAGTLACVQHVARAAWARIFASCVGTHFASPSLDSLVALLAHGLRLLAALASQA